MKQIVIGTAGHIDHGKTALMKALTGIDCDRLKEEKERGITIELGFAHTDSETIFSRASWTCRPRALREAHGRGAWGIDMVLFVVAADESVMPQTREHLDICELLGIKRGIVAITKKDLVEPDMVELVKEEIQDLVKGRFLEGGADHPVSSTTGENIDLLKEQIRKVADEIQERQGQAFSGCPLTGSSP